MILRSASRPARGRLLRRAWAAPALAAVAWAVAPRSAAAETLEAEPIEVTAARDPLAVADSPRLTVLRREEIARLPVSSVEEAIALVAGADVRQRGPDGVQADVSIRGGTFEQTLVLLNGIKVSDPQTGHHNLDLPVALGQVERIEVLRGPASRAWGPNAFAGVVNVVTRGAGGRSLAAQAEGGSDGTAGASLSLAADSGGLAGRLGLAGSRSDGYRHNTDYEIGNASLAASLPAGPARLDLLAGHTEKDFGANGFYSDRYPNQREDTGTTFVSVGTDVAAESVLISPRLAWRRHRDHYLLDFEQPSLYENHHRTDVVSAELQTTVGSAAGTTTLGAEWGLETIESSSLGDHERRRAGLFGNHRFGLGPRASLSAGAFAAHHSGWGWEIWPGADLAIDLGGGARLRASVDKSYRVPTFTELYYRSPASLGNPDLLPEEAWTWEAGADWRRGGHRLAASFFRREGTNLIDWVRSDPSQPWQVQNSAHLRTDGIEASWEWQPPAKSGAAVLRSFRAGYAFLDTDRAPSALESRYLLDHLRHQLVATADLALGLGLVQTWRLAWEDRMNGEEYLLLDMRLLRRFGRGEVYVDATNLLDAEYSAIPGVPQPGRRVMAGLRFELGPW